MVGLAAEAGEDGAERTGKGRGERVDAAQPRARGLCKRAGRVGKWQKGPGEPTVRESVDPRTGRKGNGRARNGTLESRSARSNTSRKLDARQIATRGAFKSGLSLRGNAKDPTAVRA